MQSNKLSNGHKLPFALWHSRQCGVYGIPEKRKTSLLNKQIKDGEIIATAAQAIGIKTVRGSQKGAEHRHLLKF